MIELSGGSSSRDALLCIAEVVEFPGVSRLMLFQLVSANAEPVVRIGRLVRTPRDALRHWIDNQDRDPEAQYNRWSRTSLTPTDPVCNAAGDKPELPLRSRSPNERLSSHPHLALHCAWK